MGSLSDEYKVNNSNLCLNILPQLSVIPPLSNYANLITTKIDSGASGTYLHANDEHILQQPVSISNGPKAILPDSSVIDAHKQGHLRLPDLSPNASKAYVFKDLTSASLLSVGQLCDDGCTVTFSAHDVKAFKNGKEVIHGSRNYQDRLWDVKFDKYGNYIKASTYAKVPTSQTCPSHCINVIIPKNLPLSNLIQFYQGCLFSPTKRTLLDAIRSNNFITWPGLTLKNVQKYFKETVASAKGHLDQERKNLQSTKPLAEQNCNEDTKPTMESGQKTYNVLCNLQAFEARNTGYSDLTGRFPFASTRGNEYVLIMYDYNSNAILAHPVKNRQAAELKSAFLNLYQRLVASGAAPTFYVLDNECSGDLKHALKKNQIKFQLAPPHQHRRNAAERAIQTFKNHFIAGLSSTYPDFPVHEWDCLIKQAEMTLNMMHNARTNPKLSAYEYLNGTFHFPSTPRLPPGS